MVERSDIVKDAAAWNPTTQYLVLITMLRHGYQVHCVEKSWVQQLRMLEHDRTYSSNVPRQAPVQVQEYNAIPVGDQLRNPVLELVEGLVRLKLTQLLVLVEGLVRLKLELDWDRVQTRSLLVRIRMHQQLRG